jgi:hypothetical protein
MRKTPLIASFSLLTFACLPLTSQAAPTELNPPAPAAPATNNLSAADEQAIRNEMATLVEDATLPQRFDQLVNQFSWPDRATASTDKKNVPPSAVAAHEKMDLAIADFQKSWKAKYHQDFNLRGNESKVFSSAFARIDVGDFGDAARTAGERVPANAPATQPTPKQTGVNTTPPANPALTAGNHAQLPGRKTENAPTAHTPTIAAASQPAAAMSQANNRALATIPKGHDAAPVILHFVQEGGAWKLEAPGQVDRQLLADALARHLDMATHELTSKKAASDPNEAYRAVSHHVFLAIQEATMMKNGTDNGSRASAD